MTAAIDKTNFTGAVKYVFSKLREKYPTTPIVVLSMLHVYHPTSFGTWREIAYSDGQYGGEITILQTKMETTMVFGERELEKQLIFMEYHLSI